MRVRTDLLSDAWTSSEKGSHPDMSTEKWELRTLANFATSGSLTRCGIMFRIR